MQVWEAPSRAFPVSSARLVRFLKKLAEEWEPKPVNLECERSLMRPDMATFNVFQKRLPTSCTKHSHS